MTDETTDAFADEPGVLYHQEVDVTTGESVRRPYTPEEMEQARIDAETVTVTDPPLPLEERLAEAIEQVPDNGTIADVKAALLAVLRG